MLAAIGLALAVDAAARSRGDLDHRLVRSIRGTDFPGAAPLAEFLYNAGDPVVLLVAWFVGVAVFGVLRRWLELAAWASFAVAGGAAWALAEAVGRPRPGPTEVDDAFPFALRATAEAFPSATALGSVLLLGFLGVIAGRLPTRRRWLARTSLALLALAMGWASIRLGRNWVGDVVAGYALGGLVLLAVATAYGSMVPVFGRLPFVRAAPVPHPEEQPHAHALTSLVLFGPGTVTKIYNPGFVPRFIYWLSFQAPFAYAYSEAALRAAVLRRNLAGMLTEYWYGSPRVSHAIGVAKVNGRLAITGHFVPGTAPSDRHDASAFLAGLATHFDEAGLPTWQVDPRQPRALGNIIETVAGEYMVIDLESGMVSPLASPRAWWRAVRRARVPFFDDVYFDVTRAYIAREADQMRGAKGPEWVARLEAQVAAAEAAQATWQAGEPRFWSAALRFAWSGFGVGPVRRWVGRKRDRGRELATEWLGASIDRWEAEGRYTHDEAVRTRATLADPGLQEVLPHLGVHLVIGLALRFPFGAVARTSYTLANLLLAFVGLVLRRTDLRGSRRAVSIHSPLVLVVAAVPGVGTFSYLLSGPMLANHRLWRVAVDTVGVKFPFQLYRRLGVQRVVAGRVRTDHGAREVKG